MNSGVCLYLVKIILHQHVRDLFHKCGINHKLGSMGCLDQYFKITVHLVLSRGFRADC